MNTTEHLVALDLGSNSFHLVVAIEQAGCIKIIHSQKQKVFLANGLSSDNVLSQTAINAGVQCLAKFNKHFANLESVCIRAVATHTLRKAVNKDDFLHAAYSVFPYPIEIIDGPCEAELIFQGVVHTEPLKGKTLVIDIGGGSTELVIGENFNTDLTHSVSLGSSGLAKQFFADGKLSLTQFNCAQAYARDQLQPIADLFRLCGWRSALGTSGSIKAIKASIFELYKEEKITYKYLKRLKKQLILWQRWDQIPLKTIDEKRLPLLAPAVAILISCFEMLCIPKLSFCPAALREGVLYGMSSSRTKTDIHQRTIQHLCHLHHANPIFSRRLIGLLQFFNQALALNSESHSSQLLNKRAFNYLQWAAHLHEIGININRRRHHLHAKYIINHSPMPGFSQTQKTVIAHIVGAHRGKIHLDTKELQRINEPVAQLIQLFRVAIILTKEQISHTDISKINFKNNRLSLIFNSVIQEQQELMALLDKEVCEQARAGLAFSVTYH